MADNRNQDDDTIPLKRDSSPEYEQEEDNDMDTTANPARAPLLSLSSRVRSIIEEGHDGEVKLSNRTLFTQLDVLSHCNDGQSGWKEMARWMKYQELVENGDRWSKPHVPTGSMHSINEVRRLIADKSCAVGLGLNSDCAGPNYIAEALVETLKDNSKTGLTEREAQLVLQTILKPHKHMHRKPTGKKHPTQNGTVNGYNPTSTEDRDNNNEVEKTKKSVLRRRSGEGTDIALSYHNYPPGARPDNLKPYKPNKHLTKKLPKGCEAANILIGQVDYLTHNVVGFCRFDPPRHMDDLTEVDAPTRFIFVALGPKNSSNIWDLTELGKAVGSLLNDKVFSEVAYKATTREDLLDGIDEFIDDLTVLPPSIWDCNTRLEPPASTRSMDKILLRLDETERVKGKPTAPPQEEGAGDDPSLIRTGKLFGGLIYDIKHRYKYFLSDFTDGLHIQCLASTIFLFFACISPIVTFGGLMGQATKGYMGTMEMLLAGAICGFFFSLFAGQPLTIVGATGPLLIFESILFRMCDENAIDFMSLRFWVGAWITLILIIIVMFDLSALVRFITRFTEECFSILISVIFIYEACMKVVDIYHYTPVHSGVIREDPKAPLSCFCEPSDWLQMFNKTTNETYVQYNNWTYNYPEKCKTLERRITVKTGCLSIEDCLEKNQGNLTGNACSLPHVTHSVPDVFFLSLLLTVGTYSLAMGFRNFRTSRYFPSRVRTTVADFAVFLSIVIFTTIDYLFGLATPKLNVPAEFVTTRPDRTWVINPGAITYIWLIPLAVLPALLATILIFLDQQITAVIVNRREHKMKKGHGYHLDLLVLALLILVCSLLGLPWFVAATVRSLTHVKSLFKESEVSIPGERPQMLGVREQRVTGMAIHLLIGLSTLITGVLRMIPMPVLYGVFLYMGLTSLGGVQFIERIAIMFMPMKYQPDYIYLRHVRTKRVHLFTIIQLTSFIIMWVIKSVKATAIAFPIMLIILMCVRKVLDFIFTQSELYWLDHLLPEGDRREAEDRKKAMGEDGVFHEDHGSIVKHPKSAEANA